MREVQADDPGRERGGAGVKRTGYVWSGDGMRHNFREDRDLGFVSFCVATRNRDPNEAVHNALRLRDDLNPRDLGIAWIRKLELLTTFEYEEGTL